VFKEIHKVLKLDIPPEDKALKIAFIYEKEFENRVRSLREEEHRLLSLRKNKGKNLREMPRGDEKEAV